MVSDMNEIIRAIKAIRPGKKFSFTKNEEGFQVLDIEHLDWLDNDIATKPTEAQILAEVARQEAEQYKQLRAAEYPPVADYLDGIVKGDQAQIDAYIAACMAVKNKYPKPE